MKFAMARNCNIFWERAASPAFGSMPVEAFKLSDFPREPHKRQAGVKSLTKVELHSVCRMPHSDRFNGHSAMNAMFGIIRNAWTYQTEFSLLLTKFSGFAKFVIDFSIVHISLS